MAGLYRLRGVAPGAIERDMVKMARAVDDATSRDMAKGGIEGAVRTDTAAGAAATAAIEERK